MSDALLGRLLHSAGDNINRSCTCSSQGARSWLFATAAAWIGRWHSPQCHSGTLPRRSHSSRFSMMDTKKKGACHFCGLRRTRLARRLLQYGQGSGALQQWTQTTPGTHEIPLTWAGNFAAPPAFSTRPVTASLRTGAKTCKRLLKPLGWHMLSSTQNTNKNA